MQATSGPNLSGQCAGDYAGEVGGKTMTDDHLKVNGRLQKNLRPFTQNQALVKAKVNCGLDLPQKIQRSKIYHPLFSL
jgi:hypothetical protein